SAHLHAGRQAAMGPAAIAAGQLLMASTPSTTAARTSAATTQRPVTGSYSNRSHRFGVSCCDISAHISGMNGSGGGTSGSSVSAGSDATSVRLNIETEIVSSATTATANTKPQRIAPGMETPCSW